MTADRLAKMPTPAGAKVGPRCQLAVLTDAENDTLDSWRTGGAAWPAIAATLSEALGRRIGIDAASRHGRKQCSCRK